MIRITPFIEGIDVFDKLGERASELSDKDLGFIGGVIKQFRPQRILEIGVSAGGTTCFVMNTLDKLGLDNSKVFSVDLSRTYHYDTRKKCGYQIDDAKGILSNWNNHSLCLGRPIATIIDDLYKESSQKFDMLILDTTHYLPGELLDFIVCYPYLKEGALVVLDDLEFAHSGENTLAFATRLLYDTVVAEKVFSESFITDKMQAFRVNDDTLKYMENLFSGLMIPWNYLLEEYEQDYIRSISDNYPNYGEYFLQALETNSHTVKKKKNEGTVICDLLKKIDSNKQIYIFGAGKRGKALSFFLKDRGYSVSGFVISDDRENENSIFKLNDIIGIEDKQILVAAADEQIIMNLEKAGVEYINTPNYIYPFIKEYKEALSSINVSK